MNYSLNIGEWNSVFAVPSSVVDKYIKLAGANSLKLLLYLLRHGGKELSEDKLKSELGFSEAGELEDAALFWVQRGIIHYNNEERSALTASPEENAKTVPPAESVYIQQTLDDITASDSPKTTEKPVKIAPAKVSSGEIASRMKDNDEIKVLFSEAEQIYGRPLRQRDNQTIIALVDHYGLPAGAALMLLKYCFGVNKTSPAYIEAAAAGWSAEGIDSIEKADAKIRSLEKSNELESRLRREFGVTADFTTKQKNMLRVWIEEWGFSEEMIKLAISKTVESTGKFALNYTNKILENWKRDNITAPEQTDPQKDKPREKSNSSYDVKSIMSDVLKRYNNGTEGK